jgi:hypothetical protein
MARNVIFNEGNEIELPVASGSVSGDPVVAGQIPGLATTDRDATTGLASVKCNGVVDISVKAIDGGGNSAVAIGDILYHVQADTPKVSKKNTGVRYGYALEAITSGATDTIRVKLGY